MADKKGKGPLGYELESDASFVQAQFVRTSICGIGEGVSLYGSSLKHRDIIALKVAKSQVNRSLNRDSNFPSITPMLEVWFSPNQFAELLTTMNYGSGTCGTLKKFADKRFDTPVLKSRTDLFKEEIREDLDEALEKLKEATDRVDDFLSEKKPMGRKEKEELKELISKLDRFGKSHLPFIMKQFGKFMDKTVAEAKASVDAHATRVVQETGIDTIQSHRAQIEDFPKE